MQAHAYAQGTDVHLGPDHEEHLPHELGYGYANILARKYATTQRTVHFKVHLAKKSASSHEKPNKPHVAKHGTKPTSGVFRKK